MAVTHTHPVAEEGPTTHVDSFGTQFGDDVHARAWGAAKAAPSDLVEHTHDDVTVILDEAHGGPVWSCDPEAKKAEKAVAAEAAQAVAAEAEASEAAEKKNRPTSKAKAKKA